MPGKSQATSRHIALLRGVNVGGHNRLPMARLRSMLEHMGCTDVRTYIQSGNAVFEAKPALAGRIGGLLAHTIEDEIGVRLPVVTRSATEIADVISRNPFGHVGDHAAVHVGFLADKPTAANARSLDPDRSPGDSFHLRGREIYLHLPNGAARTKFTGAYLESALQTTATARNWRTVLKLAELCEAR